MNDLSHLAKVIGDATRMQEQRGQQRALLEAIIDVLHFADKSAAGETHPDVEVIRDRIESVLARFEVVEMECVGQRFDPQRHEAAGTREDEGAEPGTIVEVAARGFVWNDQLLVAPKVWVQAQPAIERETT